MTTIDQPATGTIQQTGESDSTKLIGLADFEAIYQCFQGSLTRFVYRIVHNDELAKDLVQDTFTKVYKAFLGGKAIPSSALKTWLYQIASNGAIDVLRRQRIIAWVPLSALNEDRGFTPTSTVEERAPGEGFASGGRLARSRTSLYSREGPSNNFEDQLADREMIEHLFRQLPPHYAICLWLYENSGFSCPEIADLLHISISAVKMRLVRAREKCIIIGRQSHNERKQTDAKI